MKKYRLIVKNESMRQLAYRGNVFAYRIGHIAQVVIQLLIWSVVFRSTGSFSGYTYGEMLGYVLFGNLISSLSANYGLVYVVERDIYSGSLANFLTKPLSYFGHLFAFSLGRSWLAACTSSLIIIAITLAYQDLVTLDLNLGRILFLLLFLLLAATIRVYIALLFGMISFWTTQIEGLNYCLNIADRMFSGLYFPLDLLPSVLSSAALAAPFAYSFFIPTRLMLGRIAPAESFFYLAAGTVWLVALYCLCRIVWHYGIRKYESVGT